VTAQMMIMLSMQMGMRKPIFNSLLIAPIGGVLILQPCCTIKLYRRAQICQAPAPCRCNGASDFFPGRLAAAPPIA
jgi:hypothetical protein